MYEEKMVESIGGGRQEISPEPQKVSVASVYTGDCAAPHMGDLLSDREARNGRSSEVIIGDKESVGDLEHGGHLGPQVVEARSAGRLDLAQDRELLVVQKGRGRRWGKWCNSLFHSLFVPHDQHGMLTI